MPGLSYILFPKFMIKCNLSFGLGEKGLLIVGIVLIIIAVIGALLTFFSGFYKKFIHRYRKIFLFLYTLNWIITIIIVLVFLFTAGKVAQSILG